MRNHFAELTAIDKDGTYLIKPEGIVDYAERWAYGYIVGVRELKTSDLKDWTLIGRWTNPEGDVEWDLVVHVDAWQDAVKMAKDYDQRAIWDLRDKKEVFV